MRWRQRVIEERSKSSFMTVELLAAEILKIRILDPTRAKFFIREVEGKLENRQARH
jgi:hypothetical protein